MGGGKVNICMPQVKHLTEAEIYKIACECEKHIASAENSYASARKAMDGLVAGGDARFTNELKDYAKKEAKHLVMRTARFELRLQRITNLNKKFKNRGFERRAAEMQKLFLAAVSVLKYNKKLQKQTDEEFYKAVHGGEDEGGITGNEFLSFYDSADTKVQEIKDTPDGEGEEPKAEEAKDKDPATVEGEDA